jgi:2-keto-4-pentenoate hydratase
MTSAAELLTRALIDRKRLDAISIDDPYAIRERVVQGWLEHFGGSVIGYKIACTNAIAQQHLGTDGPFYGNLLSALTSDSPARLKADRFFMRVAEAEFAFRMARDVVPGEPVLDAVEGVLPGIEIVDSRYTDWTKIGAPALTADNACHGAWIRGALVKDFRHLDLAAQPVHLSVNGKLIASGSGAAVLGNPLHALQWLANKLASQGKQLKAGDYITTGVTTDIYMAEAGDAIRADFGSLGSVEVVFE